MLSFLLVCCQEELLRLVAVSNDTFAIVDVSDQANWFCSIGLWVDYPKTMIQLLLLDLPKDHVATIGTANKCLAFVFEVDT